MTFVTRIRVSSVNWTGPGPIFPTVWKKVKKFRISATSTPIVTLPVRKNYSLCKEAVFMLLLYRLELNRLAARIFAFRQVFVQHPKTHCIARMSFSSRRRNYLLTPHRRDGLVEW